MKWDSSGKSELVAVRGKCHHSSSTPAHPGELPWYNFEAEYSPV